MGVEKDEDRGRVSVEFNNRAAVGYLVKTRGNGVARRRMEETKERTSFDGSHRNFNDLVLLQG